MRTSKSRLRHRPNRNRPQGNVLNRVFDSSGPEGKVRGTPQQLIDKYNLLARDAQLAGDRVAVENFQQHAEHYLRLMSEAQRGQAVRREEHERQNRDRYSGRNRESADPMRNGRGATAEASGFDWAQAPQPDVMPAARSAGGVDADNNAPVDTPENRAAFKPGGAQMVRRPSRRLPPAQGVSQGVSERPQRHGSANNETRRNPNLPDSD
ncbi:MAG: DUF4167 domain-containing protein [Rhodobacteraceae bacterium]|nr:DUF4167 domain-containing protein [Paracoccaceae bacterium]